ncbi:LIC_10907 family protein [Leptospira alexanderi]|uniref:LIC_10907 family protein n=1 Tax=Leptospira alexanderi TaxID=100053 RepID=UPI000990A3F9|nr:hypothetical protein [Leptospira alexanderi]
MSKWYDSSRLENYLGSLPKFRNRLGLVIQYKDRREKVPKELRFVILIQSLYPQKKILLRRAFRTYSIIFLETFFYTIPKNLKRSYEQELRFGILQ